MATNFVVESENLTLNLVIKAGFYPILQ